MKHLWFSLLLFLLPAATGGAADVACKEQIAAGTPWQTPYHSIQGAEPGPTVILVGGIHGDEPAGSAAAEQMLQWPILKGRLLVIPRANATGLAAHTRFMPGLDAGERDLNRDFPKSQGDAEPSGTLAKALWDLISAQKPDWLIDLHEGYDFHQLKPESVGSTIIDSNGEAADALAPALLAAVNATIDRPDRQFVNLSPPVDGSLARAAAAHLGAATMILETTRRDQCLSQRVRQHRVMVREFLAKLGMVTPGQPPRIMAPAAYPGLKVAIFDDAGTGSSGPASVEATLAGLAGAWIGRVGGEDIREGALDGFDLVVFPGGSGSQQAKTLGETGRSKVREFVAAGGGYVGICAGAYLAASNYPWSLAISNHQTFSETREVPGQGAKSMWYRGSSAVVTIELSEQGGPILGDHPGVLPIRYHNGPVMSPAGNKALPEYETLARFRSEVVHYEPQRGTMTGSPAIIATHFGKGRVLCVSPHPEASEALRPLLLSGLKWAAGD